MKRALATLAAGGAALVLARTAITTHRLEVTHHRVAPEGVAPVRVALLTDLHLRRVSAYETRVAEAVTEARPDLMLFAGDVVDHTGELGVLRAFLSLLPDVPLLATLGNWEIRSNVDIEALRQVYVGNGATLLVNRHARHEAHGRSVLVTGLADGTTGRPNLQHALEGAAPADAHLVLAHSPAYHAMLPAEHLAAYGAPLVLSGHTHGGQGRLFGWAPVRPPGSGPYVSGWYHRDGLPLYVSRGIGTSRIALRVGVRPEVAVFDV